MNTLSYRTKSVSSLEMQGKRKWYVIDAEDQVVGRVCTQIASILMGKNKPSFTPHDDTGDFVIVINAEKVRFTGKKWDQKVYLDHSLYPGGQKSTTATAMRDKDPRRVIERSVKGMLPKTKLGRQMYRKLFVYAGNEHPHEAQKPEKI
ncbi:MAG: 50S ribosomal protein L13 [Saprospiraceae bacterium]